MSKDSRALSAPSRSEAEMFISQTHDIHVRRSGRYHTLWKPLLLPRKRVWQKARDEAAADAALLAELVCPPTFYFTHTLDLMRKASDNELKVIDEMTTGHHSELGDKADDEAGLGVMIEMAEFAALARPAGLLLWRSTDPMDPSPRDAVAAWEKYVDGVVTKLVGKFPANSVGDSIEKQRAWLQRRKGDSDSGDSSIEQNIHLVTTILLLSRSLHIPDCLARAHELFVGSLERSLAALTAQVNGDHLPVKPTLVELMPLIPEALGELQLVKKEHGWD